MVVRKLDEAVTVYEVIDTVSVDEGKVKTDSFPFLGVRGPGFYMVVWYPPLPGPSPNPMGAITGIARATDGAAVTREDVPLANVRVSADRDLLLAGDYVATTGVDSRFVLFDVWVQWELVRAISTVKDRVSVMERRGTRSEFGE